MNIFHILILSVYVNILLKIMILYQKNANYVQNAINFLQVGHVNVDLNFIHIELLSTNNGINKLKYFHKLIKKYL